MITKFTNIFPNSTSISPEITLVITKFTNVFPKDSAPLSPEVTPTFDIAHNCIRHAPSIHLSVVSTAFSQLGEKNDGKETAIIHMLTKI